LKRTTRVVALASVAAFVLLASSAIATTGTLPGGAPISATITSPADGATILVPKGGQSLAVAGSSSVGGTGYLSVGYVFDRSGSISSSTLTTVKSQILAADTASNVSGTSVSKSAAGWFNTTYSKTNLGSPGSIILPSISSSGSTYFSAGIGAANAIFASGAVSTRVVVFVSDGANTRNLTSSDQFTNPKPIVKAFQTTGSSCTSQMNAVVSRGASGSSCAVVSASGLQNAIRAALGQQLTSLSLTGASASISPAVPQPATAGFGAGNVSYTGTTPNLTQGDHTITATAGGKDLAGTGSVQQSATVHIVEVNAGPDVGGNEGSAIALNGSPPAGGGITVHWSAQAGAPCAFANANAAVTSITCTDNGTFTVTLTASNGNSTASDDAIVTVANVAPSVTIDRPAAAAQYVVSQDPVSVSAPFSDPGTSDTFTCTIGWGDGSSSTVVNNATTPCSGNHTYNTTGDKAITVAVTDDDGGTNSASVTISVVTVKCASGQSCAIPGSSSFKNASITCTDDCGIIVEDPGNEVAQMLVTTENDFFVSLETVDKGPAPGQAFVDVDKTDQGGGIVRLPECGANGPINCVHIYRVNGNHTHYDVWWNGDPRLKFG
jgi:trimeric autotransporter adhesin